MGFTQKVTDCVQNAFAKCFGSWTRFVTQRTFLTFAVFVAIYVYICSGFFSLYSEYDDPQVIWTPAGNPSLFNMDRKEALFSNSATVRPVSIMVRAKSLDGAANPTVLSKDAFQEMIDWEDKMYNVTIFDDAIVTDENVFTYGGEGKIIGLKDMCKEFNLTVDEDQEKVGPTDPVELEPKCFATQQPLDFIYEKYNNTYNLSRYEDDKELLDKIQSGKGDEDIYTTFINLFPELMFGGTMPEEIDQDTFTGENDITFAAAALYSYLIDEGRNPEYVEKMYQVWEHDLQGNATEFNMQSKHIDIYVFTINGIQEAFRSDLTNDLQLIIMAQYIVGIYTFFFLGSCSPVHCRACPALLGLICVILSYFSGFSAMFFLGGQVTGVHNLMPFLLIGIGVDDMFVVANAVDQMPFTMSGNDRIINAMKHAGPSITITSFTNVLAFYFGSTTTLTALSSFCQYACMCILMLYLSVLTIFLPVLVWDTRRVEKKHGDCCRACCCAEDTWICCKGYCLSDKQKVFSGIEMEDKEKAIRKRAQIADNRITPTEPSDNGSDGSDNSQKINSSRKLRSQAIADKAKKDPNEEKIDDAKQADPKQETDQSEGKKEGNQEEEHAEGELASATERFLHYRFAPELLSHEGRIGIVAIYILSGLAALYGCTQVQIDFSIEYFIGKTSYVKPFYELNDEFFRQGFSCDIFVDNPDLDWTSAETQFQMIEFENRIERCDQCDEQWFKENTLSSWYRSYARWVESGDCYVQRAGIKPFDKIIPGDVFYPCLWEYLDSDAGSAKESSILLTNDNRDEETRIKAFKFGVQSKKIDSVASQGVQFLLDIRSIEDQYGFPGTFSYATEYLDFEQYVVFVAETRASLLLSLFAVFIVILFITADFTVTLLVAFAVFLVDVYILALVFYWNLTFNSIVVVQVVVAIGLAVDYSAHIGHTYLSVHPPNTPKYRTDAAKRMYKAQKSLSQMGSSIFHGAFSTFLAVAVLGNSASYIFVVFYKMWVGIIVFASSNGFLLLPVVLSYVGPVKEHASSDSKKKGDEKPEDNGKEIEMAKEAESAKSGKEMANSTAPAENIL